MSTGWYFLYYYTKNYGTTNVLVAKNLKGGSHDSSYDLLTSGLPMFISAFVEQLCLISCYGQGGHQDPLAICQTVAIPMSRNPYEVSKIYQLNMERLNRTTERQNSEHRWTECRIRPNVEFDATLKILALKVILNFEKTKRRIGQCQTILKSIYLYHNKWGGGGEACLASPAPDHS
jgi:hypothetical protein